MCYSSKNFKTARSMHIMEIINHTNWLFPWSSMVMELVGCNGYCANLLTLDASCVCVCVRVYAGHEWAVTESFS